jgi:hypothetical protein
MTVQVEEESVRLELIMRMNWQTKTMLTMLMKMMTMMTMMRNQMKTDMEWNGCHDQLMTVRTVM